MRAYLEYLDGQYGFTDLMRQKYPEWILFFLAVAAILMLGIDPFNVFWGV